MWLICSRVGVRASMVGPVKKKKNFYAASLGEFLTRRAENTLIMPQYLVLCFVFEKMEIGEGIS